MKVFMSKEGEDPIKCLYIDHFFQKEKQKNHTNQGDNCQCIFNMTDKTKEAFNIRLTSDTVKTFDCV